MAGKNDCAPAHSSGVRGEGRLFDDGYCPAGLQTEFLRDSVFMCFQRRFLPEDFRQAPARPLQAWSEAAVGDVSEPWPLFLSASGRWKPGGASSGSIQSFGGARFLSGLSKSWPGPGCRHAEAPDLLGARTCRPGGVARRRGSFTAQASGGDHVGCPELSASGRDQSTLLADEPGNEARPAASSRSRLQEAMSPSVLVPALPSVAGAAAVQAASAVEAPFVDTTPGRSPALS